MRFICKHENYTLAIKRETVAFRIMPDGTATRDEIAPSFQIEFRDDVMLPAYERLFAMQTFLSTDDRPFGAMPEMQAQPIVNAMGRVIDLTNEYRPDFHFSVFDTDWIEDDDLRELTENTLLANAGLGVDYVYVEAAQVPPPWPTYDEVDLVTCVNMCRHGGYDLVAVLEYETAHQNREDFIVEIGKVLAEKSVKKLEDDSLEVTL